MSAESIAIPLCAPVIGDAERAYVAEAMASGWIAHGPFIRRFEAALCEATGSPHAVACASGTAGLHLALLLAGVAPGDAVVVPTVTFVASVNSVRYTGAEPVFMDCDEHLGLDAAKFADFLERECEAVADGTVHRSSGRRIAAVMPVHVFGIPCDTAAIMEVAEAHGVAVVEDAAEALGSRYTAGPLAGTSAGTSGALGVLSFNANKLVTTGGGGAVLTGDARLAERAVYLAAQAKDDALRAVHDEIGYNYRFSNLHAAVGLGQIERLPGLLAHRAERSAAYRERLGGTAGLSWVEDRPGTAPNHWFFALRIDGEAFGAGRDAVMRSLLDAGIECRPLWRCNHLQKPYAGCSAYRIERAEGFERTVLNVPCGADLTTDDVARVCDAIIATRE